MRTVALVVFAVVLAACDSKPSGPPVVVYASGEAGSSLDLLFADFSSDTNIPVSVIWGESAENANNLINNIDDSVDVLITTNVADIWRAADEGVLRPISSQVFAGVETALKDPDGFWAAIEMRPHAVANAPGDMRPLVGDFDALASPEMRGRICLSSSRLHTNRSLIAMLINDRGVRKAEHLVRLWIQNLAAPPFTSQEALIAALRDGSCDYGIVDWQPSINDLTFFVPQPIYVDIDGIGVTRHAQRPDQAQQLVDWLLRKKRIEFPDDGERRSVGIAGWRDEDARLLIERAGYQ